jgi:hypothetical protein
VVALEGLVVALEGLVVALEGLERRVRIPTVATAKN